MVAGRTFKPITIIPKRKAPGKALLYPTVVPKIATMTKGKIKERNGPLIDFQK
jgi:hypothetical protein